MRKTEIGTWAEIPSPYVAHLMTDAGFDFIIIDLEHGVVDFETAQNMIFAVHSNGKQAFIRVPSIDEAWILRCLDMGCDGMIFPQVSSLDDIERIIRFSRFSPRGERGFNPFITAVRYQKVGSTYFESENKRIRLGVILEGREIFEKLDKVLEYDDIEILYIGQYDLSMALGIPGQVADSRVLDLMDKTVQVASDKGKTIGCMVHTAKEGKAYIDRGFNFIAYQTDTSLLHERINEFAREVYEG